MIVILRPVVFVVDRRLAHGTAPPHQVFLNLDLSEGCFQLEFCCDRAPLGVQVRDPNAPLGGAPGTIQGKLVHRLHRLH